MADHTYTSEYRGVEYSVLCLDWPNGWGLEIQVHHAGIPRRRDNDNLYASYEECRSAGERLAIEIIDRIVSG